MFGRFVRHISTTMPRAKEAFYAVRVGRSPGIVKTWTECELLVKNFKGAQFKKFKSQDEAEKYMNEGQIFSLNVTGALKRKVSVLDEIEKERAKDEEERTQFLKKIKTKSNITEDGYVVVYTDGACSGNGKTGARGGIGVYWGDGDPRNVSEPLEGNATSNRAEIRAVIRAFQQAHEQGIEKIEIRTDSYILIQTVTEWIYTWEENGWRTANRKPVKNQEDLKELMEIQNGLKIKWTHVSGHVGIHGNEMADGLAVSGIRSKDTEGTTD